MSLESNDQMVEPAEGADELETWLASLGDQTIDLPSLMSKPVSRAGLEEPEGDDDDPDNTDDDPNGDDTGTPEGTEPTTTGDDVFVINGQEFAREDIERLYNFDQYLRNNPDKAEAVNAALSAPATAPTGQPAVSTPESEATSFVAPEPPEQLDLEDPQTKFFWDQHVDSRRTIWEQGRQIAQTAASVQQRQQAIIDAQARADMDTALSSFRQKFPGLNDDDISSIRQEAAPLLPSLMQKLPPLHALERSMEIAAWSDAEMRPKLEAETPTPTTRQRSTTRKQRLGAISGSPRSAPKVEGRPVYHSDRDMVNEFAAALNDAGLGR